MNNLKTIAALAFGAMTVSSAFALTDGPYSISYPGSGTTTLDFPQGATVSLPKFNVGGGAILDSITVAAAYSGNSQVKFENLGAGTGSVSITGRSVALELQRPGGTGALGDANAILSLGKSLSPFSFTYTAYDGTTDYAGTSGSASSNQAYSQSDSIALTDGSDITAFSGAGSIVLPIINQVGYSVFGAGTSSIITPTTGSATVTVTYTYHFNTNVPEPKVYGAIGAVACLGLLGYRRFRNRQTAQS
jgi:hypothetical protein